MSLLASSQFRGSVQRDDRRRRLLTDDIYGGNTPVSSASSSDAPATNQSYYGDGTFMNDQLRMIDLVPRRLTFFILWLVAGLVIITGLELLHSWQCALSTSIAGAQFAAFDLTLSGNLSCWFSSLLLLAAAASAVLVYTIRRYRTDDYLGRYRIWLWAALCWFLAANDVAANLHDSFKQIIIHFTNTRIWGDGTLWWIIPYVLVFAALGSRLVMDMRPNWLSITTFSIAGGSYFVSACVELGLAMAADAVQTVMIKTGAAMFGHVMLLLSMALNARYVIFDAEGLLPRREPKTKAKSVKKDIEKSTDASSDEWTRVDSSVGAPQPILHRATASTPTSSTAPQPIFSSKPQAPAPVTRKLTKQEKKALRERLLHERTDRQNRW